MKLIVAFLVCVFSAQICIAWSEGGHHLIAELAFDELTAEQQSAVLEILKSHPRFAEDFKIPEKAGDPEHWLIGRAAYWPDVARSQKQYNRPTWHYQLGPCLVLDDAKAPANPGPVPATATLETQDLHIAQAIELCRSILRDKTKPAADRAIAICWLGHLAGDSHQPCHAGSLYSKQFPDGDRGANSISTVQSKNMHALWDGLLGPRYDAGDIKRRAGEIRANTQIWDAAKASVTMERGMDPLTWLQESAEAADMYVYTPPVRKMIQEDKKAEVNLSEAYLKQAGKLAHWRAAFAAKRLAEIYREDVGDGN